MQDPKAKNTKPPLSKKQRALVYIIVFLLIGLVLDVAVAHNIRFYAKWIECGQKPVTVSATYKGPRYYEEASALPVLLRPTSFCTPLEAERAGYSASPTQYEFPHLRD